MKKFEQQQMNEYVERSVDVFNDIGAAYHPNFYKRRLRACTAWVYETPDYIILRSYNTIVAYINKHTREFFDILRYVYGYTSTSAQHISKFRNDYQDCFDWSRSYTWHSCK